jgi:hypothetical protein
VVPFVEEAATDDVDVEDVGFSKLKGCKGEEASLEAPKIDVASAG